MKWWIRWIWFSILYKLGFWIEIKYFCSSYFNAEYVIVQFVNNDGQVHVPIIAKYDSIYRQWKVPFGLTITPDEELYPVCWKRIRNNKFWKGK